jgi:integrase
VSRKTFKKVITSPELSKQFNPKNVKLINSFLKEKGIRSSETTVRGYASDLEIWQTWNLLYNENAFFVDVKKIQFSEFFSFIVDELQVGSARFSRLRSVLSTLSIFVERFYDTEFPQFRNVILKSIESMPKNARREKTILSEEQVNKLFEYLDIKEIQISCWLALAIGSGSRFSELLRFTTDNIDGDRLAFNDIFLETLRPIKSKGRSREGKLLIKYIIKDIFWDRYQKWLDLRKVIMTRHGKDHNFIFIKNNGDPAEDSSVRTWVEKIEELLEIPFYPHCLRHYFTTLLSKSKLPSDLIQEIVGWSSEGMVKIYNDSSIKDRNFTELDDLKNSLKK